MSDGETARRAGTGASGRERRLAHEAALEEHNHELRSANKRLLARASQLEERVAARTAELAEARAQASASHREQGVFLASASHELRTPLNAILGYAEMLIEDHERGESMTVQDVVHIRDSARQLLEMINDVLDLS
ncbi:MAG: hypothetical protein KC468_07295, partial [Myxococcales bacterium]|nr:hypothetical protein [Myxococcales bacterium]